MQFERGLSDIYSAAIGFTYTRHYDLPVITNANLLSPIDTLPDGRPVYSTAVNAGTRLDPTFNNVNMVQSIGDGDYKAMTLQFARRNTKGIQWDLAYTLGKSSDNAPLTSALSVQGDAGRSTRATSSATAVRTSSTSATRSSAAWSPSRNSRSTTGC